MSRRSGSWVIALMVLAAFMVCGCGGLQLTGDANNQAMGYLAGKGTAIGIYKVAPKAAPPVEQAWMDMIGRCYGMTEIPAGEMQGFFNSVLLKEIPTLKNDPYGLSGDLVFFATLYGAKFDQAGAMTFVQPVPMVVAKAFQAGYEGGRSVALAMR